MPKRKKQQRWPDVNEVAYDLVQRSTASTAEPSSSEISRVMAALGRKGGKIGGKRRMDTLTPEQRKEIATNAAKVRWRSKHE
ncbi:MAG: hypothetical protein ABSE44_05880 [Candidatus Sulfotelmatobacter sp.]|jgi:hypothetical protein